MTSRVCSLTLIVFSLATVAAFGQAAAPADAERSLWERSAAVGLTLTRGNSRTLVATANVLATKKWDQNELGLGANGTYGEIEGDKSAESLQGFAQYNRLFTERAFGYLRLEALHDAIADVEYRLTFSPGAGYYFIKAERTTLRGELGPGFIYEKLGGETKGYFTLRAAERFDHKLNDRARIWQSVEILPQVDNWNNFLINAEVGVEASLTERLSLRTYVQDTYDNEPAPGRKKNDVKLVSALAYKF